MWVKNSTDLGCVHPIGCAYGQSCVSPSSFLAGSNTGAVQWLYVQTFTSGPTTEWSVALCNSSRRTSVADPNDDHLNVIPGE